MITKKISITLKYNPKTEKEYCCVPDILQMIEKRRGIEFASQDEIGYQLGLVFAVGFTSQPSWLK